jgi:hypothetical protein
MTTVPYATLGQAFADYQMFTWTPLTTANSDGQPAQYTGSAERTIQVSGTFGAGGTVIWEGTLDGTNWFQVKDPSSTLISFSAGGLKAILEDPIFVRPRISSGGDGTTAITCIMKVRRNTYV